MRFSSQGGEDPDLLYVPVSVHQYLQHGTCPTYPFARGRKYCVPNSNERPLNVVSCVVRTHELCGCTISLSQNQLPYSG